MSAEERHAREGRRTTCSRVVQQYLKRHKAAAAVGIPQQQRRDPGLLTLHFNFLGRSAAAIDSRLLVADLDRRPPVSASADAGSS